MSAEQTLLSHAEVMKRHRHGWNHALIARFLPIGPIRPRRYDLERVVAVEASPEFAAAKAEAKAVWKSKCETWTFSHLLKARGWTRTLVGALPGEPDQTLPNPHDLSQKMRLFDRKRVLAAESTPDFAAGTGPIMATVPSPEEIEAARGIGWTPEVLAQWDVPWPPPMDWKPRLENMWLLAIPPEPPMEEAD